jgi:exodeoxyribonuclease V alpha subunit
MAISNNKMVQRNTALREKIESNLQSIPTGQRKVYG